jgi:iron complex outermembrane recepter protein
MNCSYQRAITLAIICSAVSVCDHFAAAQSAQGSDSLEEVIVTAERLSSTEGRTPISMEVLNQSQLTTKGITDFVTLAQQDPSLNFDAGNGGGFFTLRGVSGQGGIGPAIPIAFDGFFYNVNYIFNNVLYDMDRLEVLRGPQGTLYGRNASGGLISVISNEPSKTFGGYGEITLGNYDAINSEGAINLPISDQLQFRAAFASTQHAGYRSLIYGGVADDEDAKSGRAKLAWQPADHVNLLLSYQQTHVGGAGTADNIFLLPADANNFPTHVAIPLSGINSRQYDVAFASAVNLDDKLIQWRASYDDLPFGITMTYLGGYDFIKYYHTTPTTGIDVAPLGIPATVELLSLQNPVTQNEELRFASASDQRLTWQTGVYFFRDDISHNETHFRDYAAPGSPDFVSFPYDNDQKSIAGYGQASLHATDELAFSAGLRYTHEYVSQYDRLSPSDGIFPALQSIEYSKVTWHLGTEWNVTPLNLLYAKADTGFRAGAFNLFVPADPTLPTTVEPYKPETVTAFEAGSKNRFLNDHVSVNADVFYMLYKGEQLPESNQGGVITVNAASTKIYGLEVQGAAIADPIARFDLNMTLLHARFGNQLFTNAIGQAFNIGGNRLTQSPELSATLGVEHGFPLPKGKLTIRAETKYQSGQYFDFYNLPDSYQKGYSNSSAHLIFDSQDGRWQTDLFVRNIENKQEITDESESYSPPVTMPGTYNVGFQAPRTWGVRVRANF